MIDDIDNVLADVWEALSKEKNPVSGDYLSKKTGASLSKVYSSLSKMREVDLLSVGNKESNEWLSKKEIDPILYARAVEIGIPLLCLEETVSLSLKDKKKAEKLVYSGLIDEESNKRKENKANERKKTLRGRAASRAATTDLAKIVQDAHDAFNGNVKNKYEKEIAIEAMKALETLINALEKK